MRYEKQYLLERHNTETAEDQGNYKKYKAMITDRHDGEKYIVIFKAKSKKDFIEQMGYNGCSVYYGIVEEVKVYDWIMTYTNGDTEGWPVYRKMAIQALKAEEV